MYAFGASSATSCSNILCAFGRIPRVDTTPGDGRKPRTPQTEDGILTLPIVLVLEKSIKGISNVIHQIKVMVHPSLG